MNRRDWLIVVSCLASLALALRPGPPAAATPPMPAPPKIQACWQDHVKGVWVTAPTWRVGVWSLKPPRERIGVGLWLDLRCDTPTWALAYDDGWVLQYAEPGPQAWASSVRQWPLFR